MIKTIIELKYEDEKTIYDMFCDYLSEFEANHFNIEKFADQSKIIKDCFEKN